MEDKTARWQFIGSLCLVATVLMSFAAILGMADSCQSGFAVSDIRQGKAAGCFEFWFNRYQTLLSGTLALGAAAYAARLVLRQLRFMENDRALGLQDVVVRRGRELNELQELVSEVWLFGVEMARDAETLSEALHRPAVAAFHNKMQSWPGKIVVLQDRVEKAYGGFLGGPETSQMIGEIALTLQRFSLAAMLNRNTLPSELLGVYTGDGAITEEDGAKVLEVARFFEDMGERIQNSSDAAKTRIRIDRDRLHVRLRELDNHAGL